MKGPSLFFLITAAVAVMLLVPGASSIPVTLTDGHIAAAGENVTVFLILDNAPEGLSGYNVNLTLDDPLLAEITAITFPSWATDLNATQTDPAGRNVFVRASDVNNNVRVGASQIALAAVTVRGNASGTVLINLSGANFDNENGSDIPVTLKNSVISVNTTLQGPRTFDAELISHSIPATMPLNRTAAISITVNNTGLNPWMRSSSEQQGVYLAAVNGSSGDAALFGFSRMDIPENTVIQSNQKYSFSPVLQSPNVTGNYSPAFQLRSDSSGPFGPVIQVPVSVVKSEPAIRFSAPADDNYSNETVTFAGSVRNPAITVLSIRQNSLNLTPVNVVGGNFSGTVVLNTNDVLVASAYDEYGFFEEATLRFDGDRLPGSYEQLIGFDPQNPDSDNSLTPQNEAGNGVPDGYEKLDDRLPVFVKYRLGADPFIPDTDGDGLSDEFELTRLGLVTNVTSADSDNDGVSDANEDTDSDTLTNLAEQMHGTDPLLADSDGDSLIDADEIGRGTNPVAKDTDHDALDDDSEIRLGTNPLVADSNTNSIPDGNETYISTGRFFGSSVELSITGIGDAAKRASVANVNYTQLIPDTILVSNVSAITFGNDTTSAVVRIHYFPAKVGTASNLSMFMKNETSGSFDPLPFTLDSANAVVYSTVTSSGEYAVMDKVLWDARFGAGEPVAAPMLKSMTAPGSVSYSNIQRSVSSVRTSSTNRTGLISENNTSSSDSNETSSKFVFIQAISENNTAINDQPSLVYGTDYGPGFSANIPSWALSEDISNASYSEIPINISVRQSLASTRSSAALYSADSGGALYETVANGDFSQGMAAWAPSGPDVGSNSGVSWDVQPFNGDYTSSPQSLQLSITRPASTPVQFGYYKVAHANIDTSYASQLTFWFRCSEVYKHYSTNKFKLEVGRIDRNTQEEIRMYEFPSSFSASAYQNSWTPVTLDISNTGGGMQTFYFKSYYTASQPAPAGTYSYVTFLIDDVSVQATEPPGTPTDASIRFHVYDAATGNPIQSGTVYVNRATGPESKPLKSNGYTDPFIFQTYGAYTFDVYTYGNPPLENQVFNVAKGQTGTIEVPIGAAPPQTGSLNVYSNPTGAGIYLDGNYLGLSPLAISDIPLGSHTLKATKSGYQDLTQTVIVTSGSSDIPLTLVQANSDTDQMPDIVETGGYHDPFGNTVTSDPTLADTDGDGLTDDFEAGGMVTDKNGHTFWKVVSNPRMVDSDDDGLGDYMEVQLGTDPLYRDTDNDGIPDGADDYPLTPIYISKPIEIAQQNIREQYYSKLGLIFGETGIKDGSMNWLVGDTAASSGAYFIGWMASGYGGAGDVRDTIETLYQHDSIGTGLNLVALYPVFGDGEKTVNTVRKVAGKYPAKLAELGKYMVKNKVFDIIPQEAVRKKLIDLYWNGVGTALIKGDVTSTHLLKVADRVDDLSEVVHVTPLSSGDAIPIQEGMHTATEKFGRIHYEGRHVTGIYDVGEPGTTLFPATTQVVWNIGGNSVTYPGKSLATQAEIKAAIPDWVDRAIKSEGWTEWPKGPNSAKLTLTQAEVDKYSIREIEVSLNAKTGVASVYPKSGPQVYKWFNGKWNAMP
nr:PEGA domain-containing protein [uncultured Methanoregula sp.]